MSQTNKFASLSAKQIHQRIIFGERARRFVLIALLLAVIALFAFANQQFRDVSLIAFLLLLAAALGNRYYGRRQTEELRTILTELCDPKKLGEVYREFISNHKGTPTIVLKLFLAEADFYAGDYKQANAAIKELFMEKWAVKEEILFDRIWGYYSFIKKHAKDWDEAQKDFALIYRDIRARKKAEAEMQDIYQSFLALIHIEKREFEQAKQVLQERISGGEEPYMEVFDSYWLAQVYLELGDEDAAKKLLEYVSLTGNTMSFKKDADKQLAQLNA